MNFIPKKSLGQNFLTDKNTINIIVETAAIKNYDSVIEVGPGKGSLTQRILEKKPDNLTVIEKDERLVSYLHEKFGDKIKIINEDMTKVFYEKLLKENLIIFGNLPYNISTQVLANWIKINNLNKFCKKLVLMFQKEVADRIIAKSNTKNYGRLSILSNWRMKVDKIIDIEPGCFNPSPKIKSTLLTFEPLKRYFEINDPKNLEHVTNTFFSQRRKMIKKPLKILFNNFEEIANELSLDLKLRPQNLDNLTYYKICKLYEKSIN
ncbi:ribosomal RNA small subunit methyltransferase A [Pelagibacterales bacterium SAG-MED23]|nr:ribosomal RNA small subunit methyltransferase A [Pelagibacterales bacterium SAG-MED23]